MSDDDQPKEGFKGGERPLADVEDAAKYMGALLLKGGVLDHCTMRAKQARDAGEKNVSAVGLVMGLFATWAVFEAHGQPNPDEAIDSLVCAIRQAQRAYKKGSN